MGGQPLFSGRTPSRRPTSLCCEDVYDVSQVSFRSCFASWCRPGAILPGEEAGGFAPAIISTDRVQGRRVLRLEVEVARQGDLHLAHRVQNSVEKRAHVSPGDGFLAAAVRLPESLDGLGGRVPMRTAMAQP